MSQVNRLYIYILLVALAIPSFSHDTTHTCIHDKLDFKPEILQIAPGDTIKGRALQTYQDIRILFDFTTLTGVSTEFQEFLTNTIIPPAQNYLEAALKVKPLSTKLQALSTSTMCGGAVTVPSVYNTPGSGVDADLAIFLTQSNDTSQNYIAYAGACLLDPTTYRPLFGRLNFNQYYFSPTTCDVTIEKYISVVMHEITHVLGFTQNLYDYYINPTTNTRLIGHKITKTVNGLTTTILNLPTLTSKLRAYFNCSTLEGAYLENEGGSGSAGSHFERRVFYNEYMTGSAIKDQRVTEFTLALLEGTGWYEVDYSLAEPMTYGKNKGCTFLESPCMANQMPNFEEFCSPLKQTSCGWTYRGAGVCGTSAITTNADLVSSMDYWGNKTVVSDAYADNCPTYQLYSNTDCENENNAGNAVLGNKEFYGYGGKCFMGTLYSGGELAVPYGFCFKPTCEVQSNGSLVVKVKVGDSSVVCASEGDISVPGLGGKLSCPDPTQFCNQINSEGFCKRKCSGRGTCSSQECQCEDGWTFHDCSKKGYTDNCARCADTDPFRTSCYGDSCECNPSNTTCMCGLGLLSESECTLPTNSEEHVSRTSTNSTDSSSNNNTSEEIVLVPTVKETEETSQSSNSSQNIGVIIGAVVGALILVAAGVFAGFKYGRKVLKKPVVETNKDIAPEVPNEVITIPSPKSEEAFAPKMTNIASSGVEASSIAINLDKLFEIESGAI